MGSNWAEEFRRRIGEGERKYRPAEDFDDVREEQAELEEPGGEVEVEMEEVKETEPEEVEDQVEAETKEPEREVKKPLDLDVGKRTVDLMTAMTGKRELTKQSGGSDPTGAMVAVLMGLLILQSLPTIFSAVSSALQSLMVSGGSSPQGYYPVRCPYCGYQCLGHDGMPCPYCGRS